VQGTTTNGAVSSSDGNYPHHDVIVTLTRPAVLQCSYVYGQDFVDLITANPGGSVTGSADLYSIIEVWLGATLTHEFISPPGYFAIWSGGVTYPRQVRASASTGQTEILPAGSYTIKTRNVVANSVGLQHPTFGVPQTFAAKTKTLTVLANYFSK
jgi:hypothetical protein